MVITVSDNNAIKQYNLPNNIKIVFFSIIGVIAGFIVSLFIYIGSLHSSVSDIERQNKSLAKNIENSKELDKNFKKLQLSFENLKNDKKIQKLNFDKKLAMIESSIDSRAEQKYQEKLLADSEKAIQLKKDKKIQLAKAKKAKLEKQRAEEKKLKLAKAKKAKLKKKRAEEKKKRIAAEKKRKHKKLLAKKAREKKKREAQKKKKLAHIKKLKAKSKILKNIAKKNLGKHYVWGAVGPRNFDCSGFTSYVYKKRGIRIPRTSREQSKYGSYVKRKQLKAGDLIFFDTSRRSKGIVNHVGMYIGNNKFIHASSAKKRVVITSLSKPFYARRFKWGRRILN